MILSVSLAKLQARVCKPHMETRNAVGMVECIRVHAGTGEAPPHPLHNPCSKNHALVG